MSEFEYSDIVKSMQLLRKEGADPDGICLGYEETQELLKDADFRTASSMAQQSGGNNSIGQVAGLDVHQANVSNLKVMTSEGENGADYYIL